MAKILPQDLDEDNEFIEDPDVTQPARMRFPTHPTMAEIKQKQSKITRRNKRQTENYKEEG